MIWIGIASIGLGVVVLNVWGTLRLWRSDAYERSQLVAQMILIWVVPGSAIAVVSVLDGDRRRHSGNDSTSANPQSPNADAVNGTVGHGPH